MKRSNSINRASDIDEANDDAEDKRGKFHESCEDKWIDDMVLFKRSTNNIIASFGGDHDKIAKLFDSFIEFVKGIKIDAPQVMVRDAHERLSDEVNAKRKRIVRSIEKSMDAWERKCTELPFCRLIDRVSFSLGVTASFITFMLLGRPSSLMANWYSCLIFALLSLRVHIYRQMHWTSFLFDFCYLANFIILVYLHAFPHSSALFMHIFAISSGPLACAIPLWRNSLVFHDLDKMSSIAIHFLPLVLTFQLRWYSQYSPQYNVDTCGIDGRRACVFDIFSAVCAPLMSYMVWQIAYLLKTETRVFRVSKAISVGEDVDEVTSFKMLNEQKGVVKSLLDALPTFLLRWWGSLPLPARQIGFLLLQFFYTAATLVVTLLLYRSFIAHSLFCVCITASAIWNGASYYVEIFSSRYKHSRTRQMAESDKTNTNSFQTHSHQSSRDYSNSSTNSGKSVDKINTFTTTNKHKHS